MRRVHLIEWFALLITLFFIELAAAGQSAMKFFWYDELVTLRIAHLPTLAAIFQFFNSGKDTTSFLPAMIVHLTRLPGRPEVITRLPFELAYLITCALVYWFVRRRYAAGFALAGVIVFALGYSFYYATEIRAYAFLMLGFSIASVAWQHLNSRFESRPLAVFGLWAGLSIAILFHFFGIFLFIPFAIAQFVDDRAARRIRWPAWIALLLFPFSILPMLHGIFAARSIYGHNFWAPPTMRGLMEVYTDYADAPAKILPALLILLAICLWHRRNAGLAKPQNSSLYFHQGFSLSEWTLLFLLGIFPVICFIGSFPLGVYRVQYVLPFFVGASLLAAGLVAELAQRSNRSGWILAATLLLVFCDQQKIRITQGLRCFAGKPATVTLPTEFNNAWYEAISSSTLPVVADGADTFLVLDYYGPPELHNRLILLTSNSLAQLRPSSMTNELNMETFGKTLGFNVQSFDSFVPTHPDFLVVADTAQFDYTWLSWSLLKQSRDTHDVQVSFFSGPEQLNHNDQTYLVHMDSISRNTQTTASPLPPLSSK